MAYVRREQEATFSEAFASLEDAKEASLMELAKGTRVQLSDAWLTTHVFVPNPKRVGTVVEVTGLQDERRIVRWDGWRILPSYHERYLKLANE